ncbi:Cell division protein like [Actinidia chinensis var. chinensis]|uniref:Cell division protein like n=1 Tax=Actinidia chinensis var. chinensis TaxID=1590841 RepID=A0A2R6QZV7_ACTCC|nr:Cell division protein like [Actinidia chinensis var. chinensis]
MAMLSISLSVYSPPSTAAPSSPTTTSPLAGGTRQFICKPPSLALTSPHDLRRRTGVASGHRRVQIVSMAPTPQRITRRSPQDFPAEFDRPRPGRRPDLLPQFSPMKTPLPPPMPFDPPFEEGEEEEEEELEQVEQPMQEDDGEETEQPDGAGLA